MAEIENTRLTLIDICTLMAHETVALLDTADTLDTAATCRAAMEKFIEMRDLHKDGEVLLIWVDMELEGAKKFAAEGKDSLHLIDSDRLLAVPGAAAQLSLVWALFETAAMAGCGLDSRQAMLEAARVFTEMGGLDDMILNIGRTATALDAAKLQAELADVRAGIQKIDETEHAAVGPCEAPAPEVDTQPQADP